MTKRHYITTWIKKIKIILPFDWPLEDKLSSFCSWTEDELLLDFPSSRTDILIIIYQQLK